jgi:enoyl-CoA hydratase/carnithine racemase
MSKSPVSVVTYDVIDCVALITLNRPERLNAWTNELRDEYFDALDRAVGDREIGAIVVTGAGNAFCAGGDMTLLEEIQRQGGVGVGRPLSYPFYVPKLMIGAINGACAGVGLVQSLYMDVRFAATSAKITTSFAKMGLIAESGSDWLLTRLVGAGVAMDLLASSRIVLGSEAAQLGLVNKAFPLEDLLRESVTYAATVAKNSPASITAMKWQMRRAAAVNFEEAVAVGQRLMEVSLVSADFNEGLTAFLEKRESTFAPLGEGTNFSDVID